MTDAPEPYEYDMDDPRVYRNAMGRYKTDRQLAFIREGLPEAVGRILDVGGGGGRLAIPLSGLGHDVTVMDPSEEALRLLTARTGGAVSVVHGDVMSFVPTETFDVALVIDTLKYVSTVSITEVFAKVGSFLEPGGLLVIAEINKGSWRNRLSERLGRRSGERYNIATASDYRRSLVDAGFETVREQGFVWMPLPFNSDSSLVRRFEGLEAGLRLGRWVGQSPWLLIAARKVDPPRSA